MITITTWLLVFTLAFWLVRVSTGVLNNHWITNPTEMAWTDKDPRPPRISLCIPARNEANALRETLPHFLNQDYPNYEVIVIDDRSDDDTADVLSQFTEDPNLRVLEGTEPPPGKMGKCWALNSAQSVAEGDYLCFSDADICYDTHALSSAMREALRTDADLVVFLPRMRMESFPEKLLIPTYVYIMIFGVAIWSINRDKKPRRGMGNGAFMMIRREAYQHIGGHAALLDQVIDDITLAERTVHAGFRQRVFNGDRLVSVRMYHGLSEIWDGLSKNLGAAVHGDLIKAGLVLTFMLVANYFPIIVFVLSFMATNKLNLGLSIANLILIFGSDFWLRVKMHSPPAFAFLRPAAVAIISSIMIRSLILHWRGKVVWRGRPVVSNG